MATDITIESEGSRCPITIETFTESSLADVCDAVGLVYDDERAATTALEATARATVKDWDHLGFDDEPAKAMFVGAILRSRLTESGRPVKRDQAIAVAHHLLGWSVDEAAFRFNVPVDDALTAVGLGSDYGAGHDDLRARFDAISINVPDLAAIQADQQRHRSRRRWTAVGFALAAVVLAGALVAQQRDSVPVATPAQPTVTPASSPAPSQTSRPSSPTPAPPTPAPPTPAPVRTFTGTSLIPTLVASDGQGGFVGVVVAKGNDPAAAAFMASEDGIRWVRVADWTSDEHGAITRFERVGDRYVAWLNEERNEPSEPPAMRLALSDDLVSWEIGTIEPSATQPFAMQFDYSIGDVAISGSTILALVHLEIEVDFAALSLAESYTCGHEIAADSATVKLCNGGSIDVLSLSAATTLPPRTSLYVSRNGQAFTPKAPPFAPNTAARLTSAAGQLGIADETGLRFASSADGNTWETVVGAGTVPFQVQGAATNDVGQMVGVSVGNSGPTLLFLAEDSVTQVTSVTDVIGVEPTNYTARVSTGIAGWAVTLRQANGSSWLLFSSDGVSWEVINTETDAENDRDVLVGDDEVLVRDVGASGPFTVISLSS